MQYLAMCLTSLLIFISAAVGENAEQTPAYPQRVDPQIVSQFTSFNNLLYGMPEQQQVETTQHQPHSESHQSHVYENVQIVPMHKNISYERWFK